MRAVADGIEAGKQKVTPQEFAGNGKQQAAEAPAEEATVAEGDYEQVSPGEEPVAEAAPAEPPPKPRRPSRPPKPRRPSPSPSQRPPRRGSRKR